MYESQWQAHIVQPGHSTLIEAVCAFVRVKLDVCHRFSDMNPEYNRPSIIYHSLPSLQRRLDFDEHTEYTKWPCLCWRHASKFYFSVFFPPKGDNTVLLVQQSVTHSQPLSVSLNVQFTLIVVRSKSTVMWVRKVMLWKCTILVQFLSKGWKHSDLILIGNLLHASSASVWALPVMPHVSESLK